MSSAVLCEPIKEAVPVRLCLWLENSDRLVSLRDIVEDFNVYALSYILAGLTELERAMQIHRFKSGDMILPDDFKQMFTRPMADVLEMCRQVKFVDCLNLVETSLLSVTEQGSTVGIAESEIRHARNSIVLELVKWKFVPVHPDRGQYFNQDALFGAKVSLSFPSAAIDIKEGGNCLAVESGTAAVFHFMRAAEHGLRALARDRRVKKLPKKGHPIELATWDEIIKELEAAEQAIQGYPKTLAREAQLEFYHGAMMEFKRFKNKFRNGIMHARDSYDRDEAHSAFIHVRDFMKILASRISERKKTPRIWKGKKWTKEA